MLRRILTAVTLLAAFDGIAQPASFFIERIEVRNATRVSPQVVIAESLLREGTEVTEGELRAASQRLARLPFLLSADFTLEKGSARDKDVLVIKVVETKPFFFLLDARPALTDESPQRKTINYEVDPAAQSKDAALGFRWFIGGRGIVHAGATVRRTQETFTTNYSAIAVGYTQYDILGTRAFATFNLRLPFDSPAEGLLSPQFVAGIPINARQTLTFDYEDTRFQRDTVEVNGVNFRRQDAERLIALAWTYDTTNEPFIPTEGTLVRVSPMRAMRDRSSFRFALPTPTEPSAFTEHINGYGVDLAAQRYWMLSERDSVSAGLVTEWADVTDSQQPRAFSDNVGWQPAYQIFRAGWARSLRHDTRLELEARVINRQLNIQKGEDAFGVVPRQEQSIQTSVAWARRSDWGMLRLGLGYAWTH